MSTSLFWDDGNRKPVKKTVRWTVFRAWEFLLVYAGTVVGTKLDGNRKGVKKTPRWGVFRAWGSRFKTINNCFEAASNAAKERKK